MSYQNPAFGEVINGRMWDGTEWVPVDGLKPGDVINDSMWTGTHWVPIEQRPKPKPDPLWRRWWFVLMIGFLVFCVIAALDDNPAPPPAGQSQSTPEQPAEEEVDPDVPGIDDPVVDGDLEFTVTDVDTDIHKITGTFNQVHEPQGSYTVVEMTVRNVGDNPAHFTWDNVSGTVDGGAEIRSNATGSYYANDQGQAGPFIRDLNPSAKIEVAIVFDVPDGMELKTVVGHDSLLSDGAVITL